MPAVYSRAARPGARRRTSTLKEFPGRAFTGNAGADGAVDRRRVAHAAHRDRRGQSERRAAARLVRRGAPQAADARQRPSGCPVNALIFRAEGVRVAVVTGRPGRACSRSRSGAISAHRRGRRRPDRRARPSIVNPPDSLTAGQTVRVRGRCPGARQPAVKRPALSLIALALVAPARNEVSYTPPAPSQIPPAFKENADWKAAQPADQTVARRVVGGVPGRAAERARGADRRLEPDAESAAGAVRAGACRDRDQQGRSLSAGHDVAVDHAGRIVGQPRRRHRTVSVSRTSSCRSTCRTKPTSGAAFSSTVDASRAARRRAPPISRRRASRCTPSSRSTTSQLRGIDAERAAARRRRDGVPTRARADAEPVPGRHRVAGRRRAGRDPARDDARAGRGSGASDARRSSTRSPCWSASAGVDVLAAGRAADGDAAGDSGRVCPSDLLERRPDIAAAERRVAVRQRPARRGDAPRFFRGCC